jgi:hypothetical protein
MDIREEKPHNLEGAFREWSVKIEGSIVTLQFLSIASDPD